MKRPETLQIVENLHKINVSESKVVGMLVVYIKLSSQIPPSFSYSLPNEKVRCVWISKLW